uniref:LRRCT domain-containing protein n=1 Tax=Heterorhabditis bacteriophora TaxID=37862 RepID=A0A1I7XQP0_HETBA
MKLFIATSQYVLEPFGVPLLGQQFFNASFCGRLCHLDLSSNKLLSLSNNVFSKLKTLKTLILTGNEVQLSPDCFNGLSSLETLSLSENRLAYLPPSVFRHLKGLKNLDLSFNKLLSMPASILSTIPSLRSLDLRQNLLSNLKERLFYSNWLLLKKERCGKYSGTKENGLWGMLDSGMFVAQKELEILDLSDNLLSDIDDNALFGMDNLSVLNLTSNQLNRLPGNTWPLPRLRVLDLSNNLFVALETASFDSLPSLQYLNLTNSRNLKSIHMAAFVQLSSLHWLDLSNSALSYIAPTAFSPHPPLIYLNLSYNLLSGLPPTLLPFSRIPRLYLANNRWDCTCELRALDLAFDGICISPESLVGVPFKELRPCSIFHGMLVPLIMSLVLLFLVVVVLILTLKRPTPRKSSIYQHQSLINVLSHKEYTFDRSMSSSCAHSDESKDSAYESPTSAFIPKHVAPPKPPSFTPTLPRDNYRVLTTYPVPITQL